MPNYQKKHKTQRAILTPRQRVVLKEAARIIMSAATFQGPKGPGDPPLVVRLSEFGSLVISRLEERSYVHSVYGAVTVPAKLKIRFKPAKAWKRISIQLGAVGENLPTSAEGAP